MTFVKLQSCFSTLKQIILEDNSETEPLKREDNLEIETLKREKKQLQVAFQEKRVMEAELKKKINALEGRIKIVETDNITLQEFNQTFAEENDRLINENKTLKQQLARYKKPEPNVFVTRPAKRVAIHEHRSVPERSPDELNAVEVRVRIS